MAALIPSASATGSGTMTLAGPSTNSNQTITIPDTTGTMMVSGNMPAFSAWNSANQSLSNNSWNKVNLDTEEFDTNNNFASSRFTPTVAGYYQFNGTVYMSGGTGGVELIAAIYKNGSEAKRGNGITTTLNTVAVSSLIYCNGSTDYIELYCYNGGTSKALSSGSAITYLNGCMVRGA
jgi:hypothetical protein